MKNHIESLVSRLKTACIASVDENGYPIVKMVNASRKRDGVNVMYFTTPCSTKAVADYRLNQKASVYFADESRFQTALFTGVMSIVEDEEIREVLKAEENAKIFEFGVSDEDYCVLKFESESVRFFINHEIHEYSL